MKRVCIVTFHITVCFFGLMQGELRAQHLSQIIVFGDSLSDTGNWPSSASFAPSPPYANGRFTNGPTWVDRLAERLGVPVPEPSQLGGTNYAWGGATTGSKTFGAPIVDMDSQVQEYLSSNSPMPSDLFVLWGGVNDFNAGQSDAALPVTLLHEQVSALAEAGARNILLINLPESLGQFDYPLAGQFNQLLSDALEGAASTYENASITEFDYPAFFDSIAAFPDAFGFTNLVNAACANCGTGTVSPPLNIVPNPDEYYFWDDIHPSAAAHQLIGDAVYAAMPLEGDFDLDGDIDGADFLKWQWNDGTAAGLALLKTGFGTSSSAVSGTVESIPEPTSFTLVALCLCVSCGCRQLSRSVTLFR